ncbi:SGNH/GDSL hydrolase family protein [Nocardioides psychrotolerans]|uniref:Lysophospholipase L1 n=1 Tax=Nocardioides psychrotolerans TaxID=1005945 RepID=A0A1I3H4I0_9ACTN|nr:hypothetical protein [Nocardioides psychrotolerans]SFI30675.1 Lysophospholipase L1 [Nocardioides psychrotolerans]
MPPRQPVLRAALRSALLALAAGLVTSLVVVAGVATQAVPVQADPGTEQERVARAELGSFDARLGPRACALLGRAWTSQGCSRTTCARAADKARLNANAEMCFTRSGASFGRAIDFRVCRALHRPWIAEVNLCASNPARTSSVVAAARQCVGATKDYVMVRERAARWDECVTPSRRRDLERIARRTGTTLRIVALQRSRTLCALRDHTSYVDGICRSVPPTTTQGPPSGTLLVGDSLSWRANDELARLRPQWTLDGLPGRRVSQLLVRIRDHLATQVAPSTLVVALGTNSTTSWTKQDYLDATALVPEETRVLFVTPYRADVGNDAAAVSRVDSYDRWMREITAARPHTCLADWRSLVVDDPDLLVDGTHQTPDGEAVWAQLVSSSWDAC